MPKSISRIVRVTSLLVSGILVLTSCTSKKHQHSRHGGRSKEAVNRFYNIYKRLPHAEITLEELRHQFNDVAFYVRHAPQTGLIAEASFARGASQISLRESNVEEVAFAVAHGPSGPSLRDTAFYFRAFTHHGRVICLDQTTLLWKEFTQDYAKMGESEKVDP